jgi:hypothetical protein
MLTFVPPGLELGFVHHDHRSDPWDVSDCVLDGMFSPYVRYPSLSPRSSLHFAEPRCESRLDLQKLDSVVESIAKLLTIA